MFCPFLSYSKISLYNMCQFAYYIRYEWHIRPIGKALVFGSLVHSVLEHIGETFKENPEISIQEAILKEWQQHYDALDEFDLAEIEEEDSEPYLKMLIEGVTRRERKFFTNSNIQREFEFDFSLPNGVPVKGFLDVILDRGHELEIIDWKSSKTIPKYEKLMDDPQLRLYDAVTHHLFPDKPRIITIDFLRRGPMTYAFTDRQRKETEAYLLQTYRKIISCQYPQRKKGWHCKAFCKGKENCEKYWDQYQKGNGL